MRLLIIFYFFLLTNPTTFFSIVELLKLKNNANIGPANPIKMLTGCPNASNTTTPTNDMAARTATIF